MESSDQEPTVTIVVATRNRPGDAVVAAGSVLAGDGIDFELVVVDQSDDDATEVALADLADDHRVRYVRVDRPGKTKAMNLGLRMARTPFVLFTDDDCEVPSDWAVEMVAALTEGEQVGAVFCGVVAGPHDENAGFVPTFDVPRDKTWTSTWRLATPEMGAGMAVRLAAVEEIGGFDEQMGPGGRFPSADDTDIATRLLAAGWHVVDTARTEVVHHGFRTFEQGRELTRRDWIALGAAYGKA
ncbi:MAG: glycosyltransferase, partial [Acidimicrobiales bacterium]